MSPPDRPPAPREGLRERKKRELRAQLSAIALRRFAAEGFDKVSVADLAAEAGVSEKTVFNHFPSKEDLVLGGRGELDAQLLKAIRQRPPGRSLMAVVREHSLMVAEHMSQVPPAQLGAFRKLLHESPSLFARARDRFMQVELELAQLLAEESGADAWDVRPRVVAAVLHPLQSLGYGFRVGDGQQPPSLAQCKAAIHQAFDLLEGGLKDYGRQGARPQG